jgi:hypothetical protein
VEPLALTGRFAGLAAARLGTVALATYIAIVGSKEDLTVLTLALSGLMSHWPASPQANGLYLAAWGEENAEENAGQRRQTKTEEPD